MTDPVLDRVLRERGGVVTRRDLRAAGIELATIRRGLVDDRLVRVARGRYVSPAVSGHLKEAHRHTAVLSHLSAAAAWGWPLRDEPWQLFMTVSHKRHLDKRVQRECNVSWRTLPTEDIIDGRTSALRTVEDCARCLTWPAALSVADSALRCGDVRREELSWLADQVTGRNAVAARRVLRAADGRAANPLESCLRAIALDIEGFHVQPQHQITGPGIFAMVDLGDAQLGIALEAEGFEHHGTRKGLQRDCRRYTELASLGWILLRFTYADVMGRPEWVRQMIERTIAQGRLLPVA